MGEIAALSASVLWAFASLVFAQLGQKTAPLVMNGLKCVIALALMWISLLAFEQIPWPELTHAALFYLVISGFIGLTIGDTAYFNALVRLGPRRALVFTALTPPVTALMAVPALGEPITLTMGIGMALTMGGVVWVILERAPVQDDEPHQGLTKAEWLGVAFALVGVLCQSSGNVLTKMGGETSSALAVSVVRLAAGTLGLGVIIGLTGRLAEVAAPFRDRRTTILLLVATFAGTYLGIWLLNAGLKYTFVGIAATLSSTSPIWILPLAYFILKERITPRAVLGAVIAVVGVGVLFLVR